MSINLSGTSAAARAQKHRDGIFTKSMIISFLIVLFLIGVFFILLIQNKKISGDITSVKNKIALREKEISGPEAIDVANALYRIDDAKKHDVPNSIELDILILISNYVLDGVRMETYSYGVSNNNTNITIKAVTTEFMLIAHQIDILRKSDVFIDIVVSDISSDAEGGEIHFSINMQRKEAIK